jgi:hypothetical protein
MKKRTKTQEKRLRFLMGKYKEGKMTKKQFYELKYLMGLNYTSISHANDFVKAFDFEQWRSDFAIGIISLFWIIIGVIVCLFGWPYKLIRDFLVRKHILVRYSQFLKKNKKK